MAAMTEIQMLHLRWHRKTGEDMPADIASLPIDQIRKAVDWTEKEITVAVPKNTAPVAEVVEESMMQWDKHGELT